MALQYVQVGNDEDGMPMYDWVDDGVYAPADGVYETVPSDQVDPGVITGPGSVPGSGGGVGAVTGTGGNATLPGLSANTITKWLATPGGAALGIAGLDKLLGGKLSKLLGFGTAGNAGAAGYRGKVPELTATQTQIAQPAYTPYSGQAVMGRRQLSDIAYTPTSTIAAPTTTPATGYSPIAPLAAVAPNVVAAAGGGVMPAERLQQDQTNKLGSFALQGYDPLNSQRESTGITNLARGGVAKPPRYLRGATDGMADKIDTDIDGRQAAKLSHGEFVIPADIVSHLGNGNSDAGAKVLYKMMDRVRVARTGNPKQGKEINPEKFMPGGLASLSAYAGGGAVAFAGPDGSVVPTPNPPTTAPVTRESNLSEWAGPTVTGMVGRATGLAQSPYQAYTGPLTAGVSPLQQQAFGTAANLQTPASMGQATQLVGDAATKMGGLSYKPVGSDFTAQAAQQYMNPYLQASLDPQIAEARRQSEITQMGNAAKLSQAGAYGGSRGALMQSEAQRNLGSNLANITGQGYNTAYDKAMQQFNTDQQRKLQEGQFGTTFGLQALQGQQSAGTALGGLGMQQGQLGLANLAGLTSAGATQRGIEQEGITALKSQFEEERQDPYNKLLFQQKMLACLPVTTQTTSTAQTPFQSVGGTASELETILKKMGL
jgi:hypothetical protein